MLNWQGDDGYWTTVSSRVAEQAAANGNDDDSNESVAINSMYTC